MEPKVDHNLAPDHMSTPGHAGALVVNDPTDSPTRTYQAEPEALTLSGGDSVLLFVSTVSETNVFDWSWQPDGSLTLTSAFQDRIGFAIAHRVCDGSFTHEHLVALCKAQGCWHLTPTRGTGTC